MAGSINAVGTRRTPERNSPLIGGSVVINPGAPATYTPGAAVTLTAAQILTGLLAFNPSEADTATLPTAALLTAAIPGVVVGNWFEFTIINYSNYTTTVAVGTGITNKILDSEDAILTIATHISATFALVCTGVANPVDPSTSDSWDLYLKHTSTVTS